jgi:Family of unknown function (DUF6755)
MTDAPGQVDGYGGTAPSVAGLGDGNVHPTPGRQAVVMLALTIGVLMMAIQLWLLTVSLELYLAGAGERCVPLAGVSGTIFLGGLVMLRLLERRPRLGGGQAPLDRTG